MSLSFIHKILLLSLLTLHIFANEISIDTLVKQAAKEQKHLLVFFHKFGCSFCEKMEENTLEDTYILEQIKKYFIFVDIGIDDEGTVTHKAFKGNKHAYAKFLEIEFYPTVGFVDTNSSYVHGVIGYRGPQHFLKHLKYIESNEYKEMDFEAFKTHLEFEED